MTRWTPRKLWTGDEALEEDTLAWWVDDGTPGTSPAVVPETAAREPGRFGTCSRGRRRRQRNCTRSHR